MIITYGAYCSATLDKNYVPIILKYLELYILTYSLDDVLSELSKNSNKQFVKAGSGGKKYKIVAESDVPLTEDGKEIVEISDFKIYTSLLTEQNMNTGTKNPPQSTGNAGTGNRGGGKINTTPKSGSKPIIGGGKGSGSVTDKPEIKTQTRPGDINRAVVSIEPTWLQVTYNDSTFMLGIKVIPIYFKDETTLVNELMKDLSYKKGLKLIFEGFKRGIKGWYRRLLSPVEKMADMLGWEIFDRKAPQGIKIKNKVIFATSSLKHNLFIVLNKNNIPVDVNEVSFKHLFSVLKWCSLIFMDDVNQQVSFCMQSQRGMCAVLPYRVLIHSTMNKGMGQAYQDIDEVQNAVSSVFRTKKSRITKLFGEMQAAYSMIDIRKHLIESVYLQENSEKYLTNPDLAIEMYKKIRFISKSSDLSDIQHKLSSFPTKTPAELNSFINKNSKNFKKLYTFAKKVIKNSVPFELSDNDLEILSYIIAYRSANMRGPNQLPRLRDLLKQFIYDLNKNKNDKIDNKVILFRTIVDVFNKTTSILKYHDFDSDEERQEIIKRNLYVFLNLVPLLVLK